MIEKFLTTEQVANILQVHPFTILKFIREGKLKGVKLGRVYRIKESDVHEFLEERMTQHKSRESSGDDSKPVVKEKEIEKLKPKPGEKHFKIEQDSEEGDQHYYII